MTIYLHSKKLISTTGIFIDAIAHILPRQQQTSFEASRILILFTDKLAEALNLFTGEVTRNFKSHLISTPKCEIKEEPTNFGLLLN